jgi:hypothetical protein
LTNLIVFGISYSSAYGNMLATEQLSLVESETPVLTLPWVVGDANSDSLALTTVPLATLPTVNPSPEVSGLVLNDELTRGLLDAHVGDDSYERVGVLPLCATEGGRVVARVIREPTLDVVAIVGHIRGSPADPDSSGLQGLIHTVRPQEERILKQPAAWERKFQERGSTSLDSELEARGLSRLVLHEYEVDSNLGRVLRSLGEPPEFVSVEDPGRKIRTHAEKGVIPRLFKGMENYAEPRVVGYRVLEANSNIVIADVEANSALEVLPKDPPIVFPLNRRPVERQWAPFVGSYSWLMERGVDLLVHRPRHPLTGEHRFKRVSLGQLAREVKQLNPDRPGSAAEALLLAGIPTDIAGAVIGSAREPFLRAAELILEREHFHSYESWLKWVYMRLALAGFEG